MAGTASPTRAEQSGGARPFGTDAVSNEALGDSRGHGLSNVGAVAEMRLSVVLWDEVPAAPPRRPPPRISVGASAPAPNTVSVNAVSSSGPGG